MRFFLPLLILALLSASLILASGQTVLNTPVFSGIFNYYFAMKISFENVSYPGFIIGGTVRLEVRNNTIMSIVGDIEGFTSTGSPYSSRITRRLARAVLGSWMRMFRLVESGVSGEETYTSVDGVIVKAYIVRRGGGVEYREVNTGVYLGGFVKGEAVFNLSRGNNILLSYEGESILVNVTPTSILSYFYTVNPPVRETSLVGGVLSLIILGGAVYTIITWKNYNMDIFSQV